MKIESESYGDKWIYIVALDEKRKVQITYNPRTDGANLKVLGKDTASLQELNQAEKLVLPHIIEKHKEN